MLNSIRFVSKTDLLAFFTISCLIALLDAYFNSGYGDDMHGYFSDSTILYEYLTADFYTYYQILFKKGGGFIPYQLAEPLFAIGAWGNPSMYLMDRLFTVFSLLSANNIYTISLFFAFTSFLGKYFCLRIASLYNLSKKNVFILIFLLFFGGIDCLFISGLYKENIIFLLLSFTLYYFLSDKNWAKTALFLVSIYYLYILKSHNVLIIYIGVMSYFIVKWYFKKDFFHQVLICLAISMNVIAIWKLQLVNKIIVKKIQFDQLSTSNSHLGVINLHDSIAANLLLIPKTFFRTFCTPIYSSFFNLKTVIINISNLEMVFLCCYFLFYLKIKHTFLFYYATFVFIIMYIIIGFLVPNYGTILRYRSVYMILYLLILGINSQIKNINKINI